MLNLHRSLPMKFTQKSATEIQFIKAAESKCMLCLEPKSKKIPLDMCMRCNRVVCPDCLQNKRMIAQNDSREYAICDKCETDMENFGIRNHLQTVNERLVQHYYRIMQQKNDMNAVMTVEKDEIEQKKYKQMSEKAETEVKNQEVLFAITQQDAQLNELEKAESHIMQSN